MVHAGAPVAGAAPADALTPDATTPKSGGWLAWLKGLFASDDAVPGPEPGDPFRWTEEEVALLGDAPFDTGFILTGKAYFIELRKAAAKSYGKFAYAFNRLGFKNPLYLVLLTACIQYFTALGRAFWRWRGEAEKPAEDNGGAPAL